uniref:SAM-dependent MTase RsmB/NOP-type domain-containing protein n=1 Tax=Anopheles farauti TaxID=69004 RepID=A0A182Q3E4_9DIPT
MGAPAAAAGQREVAKKITVPTNYRKAAKYVRMAVDQGLNVKKEIEEDAHFRTGRTIVGRVLSNLPKIDALYGQLELATKEPRLDGCLARVLIAELLFGSGRLVGNSRPVECIRQYAEQLQEALATARKMRQRKKAGKKDATGTTPSSITPTQSQQTVTTDDPYTIPLHSRQAAFAILWLLVYSFAMFTLPFGAFYGTRHILAEQFAIEGFHNTCGSVLAAVLTVNVIIMLYAFRGFREVEEEDRERPRFVRINTNVLNLEGAHRLLQEEQWILVEEKFADYRAFLERVKTLGDAEYLEDFHFTDLLVFPHSAKSFWSRATHLHDKFVLQNKACLLPTYLLKPGKKSVVLDMCAAPGLKTTHLACLMKNKGRIYAVERCAQRYQTLCQYASPYGVIKTLQRDCLDLTDELVPGVEYILLDPSCSGSGMMKRQQVPEPMDESRVYKLAGLQYKLLSHAMNAFPNVRRIVYSTCSLYEQENEGVVHGVLRHNGHFRLLDARKEFGKEWLNVGNPETYPGIGQRCLYARTEDDLTIGMFVAVFERCPEGVQNEVFLAHEKQKQSYERVAARYGALGANESHQQPEPVAAEADNEQEVTGTASNKKQGGKRAAPATEQPANDANSKPEGGGKKRKKNNKQQV